MITHIDITGVNSYAPDERVRRYVQKKIGALDRLAPRSGRESLRADVKIAEVNRKGGNKYEIEVLLHMQDRILTAKDSTMNVMAATDIVEQKLAVQLRKYKQDAVAHLGQRRLLDRFKRGFARELQA